MAQPFTEPTSIAEAAVLLLPVLFIVDESQLHGELSIHDRPRLVDLVARVHKAEALGSVATAAAI